MLHGVSSGRPLVPTSSSALVTVSKDMEESSAAWLNRRRTLGQLKAKAIMSQVFLGGPWRTESKLRAFGGCATPTTPPHAPRRRLPQQLRQLAGVRRPRRQHGLPAPALSMQQSSNSSTIPFSCCAIVMQSLIRSTATKRTRLSSVCGRACNRTISLKCYAGSSSFYITGRCSRNNSGSSFSSDIVSWSYVSIYILFASRYPTSPSEGSPCIDMWKKMGKLKKSGNLENCK